MDIDESAASSRGENAGGLFMKRGWWWLKALPGRLKDSVVEFTRKAKKLGKDDPRRIVHSIKVGLTISLVSLLYYFRPIYGGFGASTMWAVLTVVVVFEYTVGATLSKVINRALATFLAGALGLGGHRLATLAGDQAEPILLWLFVFLLATASSFTRFFPGIKARYDYGVLMFILTFSLVSVSGYRDDEILQLAYQRLSTIIIGCFMCVLISIIVVPVWAGQDLHNLIVLNLQNLADFLQGFGGEYFGNKEGDKNNIAVVSKDKSFLRGYKNVLNSKAAEESMANFARWEPPHSGFRFGHPWKQYLKIGTLIQQCAYRLEALNNCMTSGIQPPSEFMKLIQDACMEMSMESGKALEELSSTIKERKYSKSVAAHIRNSKTAVDNLRTALKNVTLENTNILEQVIPAATVTCLLVEIVGCIEKIAESINELACLAKFKDADLALMISTPEKSRRQLLRRGHIKSINPVESTDATHALIAVCALSTAAPDMINYGNSE